MFVAKYLGAGWGRAVALLRPDFPGHGQAVLKVQLEKNSDNETEAGVIRAIQERRKTLRADGQRETALLP